MKVHIQCNSLLLQKALENFLKRYVTSLKHCDIVLSDTPLEVNKPLVYISNVENADLQKPFSKRQLYNAIEKVYKKYKEISEIKHLTQSLDEDERSLSLAEAEERIKMLTLEYSNNIIKVLRSVHEK